MAVFLFGAILALGLFSSFGAGSSKEGRGILGGPVLAADAATDGASQLELDPLGSVDSQPAIIAYSYGDGSFSVDENYVAEDGALSDPGQPIGPALRGNLLVYRVQKGDTLSGIAKFFGISLDTLIGANPGIRARLIKAGDELNILPVSGVVYTTKNGDSLESIAAYFNLSEKNIIEQNQGIDFGNLGVGVSLIIPGAKSYSLAQNGGESLPSFGDHFARPTEGFNWGILHNHNAVDIANSCGTPIRAAAEGLVVPDSSFGDGLDGWNGGYGKFVLIEHPFGDGVRTRYAHMTTISVNIGDYVEQGQVIGTMGQTGDATGCHLHFEVYGAVNPLAK